MGSIRNLILCLPLLCLVGGLSARGAEPAWPVVGRVKAVDGGAATRGKGGEWGDSGVNDAVAAGMSVRTADQGRTILRLGADTVALAGASEIDFTQLDSSATEIALKRGRIGVRLSAANPAHTIEIDTPRGQAWLLTPGDYEIAAGDQTAPTRIGVFDGRARFVGKGVDTIVAGKGSATLSGANPVVANAGSVAADDFSAWWRLNGADHPDSLALRYLSPGMTGYAALDGNGSWETIAGYGPVWFPSVVPSGWAPYRYGHWRWLASWGWTWVDDMSWGFAPSHYGRWAMFPDSDGKAQRWGWVPGKRTGPPGFMPAAVAFLGTAGVGLSYPDASGPAVAWFPLGPGEVYWPSYTSDLAAIRQINDGAVADTSKIAPGPNGKPPASVVDGAYKYRRYATVVPRPVFVGGKPVAPSQISLPDQRLDNAPLLAGSPQIAPAAPKPAVAPAKAVVVAAAVPARRVIKAVQTLRHILHGHKKEVAGRWRIPSAHVERPRAIRAVFAHERHSHRPIRFVALRRRR